MSELIHFILSFNLSSTDLHARVLGLHLVFFTVDSYSVIIFVVLFRLLNIYPKISQNRKLYVEVKEFIKDSSNGYVHSPSEVLVLPKPHHIELTSQQNLPSFILNFVKIFPYFSYQRQKVGLI